MSKRFDLTHVKEKVILELVQVIRTTLRRTVVIGGVRTVAVGREIRPGAEHGRQWGCTVRASSQGEGRMERY